MCKADFDLMGFKLGRKPVFLLVFCLDKTAVLIIIKKEFKQLGFCLPV